MNQSLKSLLLEYGKSVALDCNPVKLVLSSNKYFLKEASAPERGHNDIKNSGTSCNVEDIIAHLI